MQKGPYLYPTKHAPLGEGTLKFTYLLMERAVLSDKLVLLLPGLLFNWFSIRARVNQSA